jgi:hypothetical protein
MYSASTHSLSGTGDPIRSIKVNVRKDERARYVIVDLQAEEAIAWFGDAPHPV